MQPYFQCLERCLPLYGQLFVPVLWSVHGLHSPLRPLIMSFSLPVPHASLHIPSHVGRHSDIESHLRASPTPRELVIGLHGWLESQANSCFPELPTDTKICAFKPFLYNSTGFACHLYTFFHIIYTISKLLITSKIIWMLHVNSC